ncbi:MAG: hypothetical protein M9962_04810 [Oligoflexia bacterium]|nr:hypothetical protein [Oligoflexia bacterium]
MNFKSEDLEMKAAQRKIRIHEPFAEFLQAQKEMHTFELSLLDCYKAAGHACHSITGAFLVTELAIQKLFPETNVCERGDIKVDFGSKLEELATGPRSNIISYITGAWGVTGFSGFSEKRLFVRKNIINYDCSDILKTSVRFSRITTGKSIVINYNANAALEGLNHKAEFPQSWRVEISAILNNSKKVVTIVEEENKESTCGFNGCC